MSAHPTRPETDQPDTDLRRQEQAARDDTAVRDDGTVGEGRRAGTRLDDDRHADDRHADDRLADDRLADDRLADDRQAGGLRRDDDLRRDDMTTTDDARVDDRPGQADMRTTGDIDTSYRSGSSAAAAAAAAGAGTGTASVAHGGNPLLGDDHDLSSRWDQVQATFVDDPRRAVSDAAGLVEDTLKRLSDTFARERSRGEGAGEDEAGTEDLRLAMQRYREFFRRLLAA